MMTIMKKYIVLFIAAVSLLSCDDFLDKKPSDQIAAEVYFNDEGSPDHRYWGCTVP